MDAFQIYLNLNLSLYRKLSDMGKKSKKTLAMKVLEGQDVVYEPYNYPITERDALVIADHFGVNRSQVLKTLVVKRPLKKPLLIMVPANFRLNLKKLAQVTGDKKLKMSTHAEAEKITGLKVGGISPLALLNKGFSIFLERTALEFEDVFVSAGQKGLNLKVAMDGLIKATAAQVADVADLAD